jgi:hypothetical protein
MGFAYGRISVAKAEFPSNSHPIEPRIDQIAKLKALPSEEIPAPVEEKEEAPKEKLDAKVTFKRKKVLPRLRSLFVEEGRDFGDHLVENVIVPMVKDVILSVIIQTGDSFRRGFEQVLFPNGTTTNHVQPGRPPGPISYDQMSRSAGARRSTVNTEYRRPQRQSNRVDDLSFTHRADADQVLGYIESQILEIGHCTVGDLYDYVDHEVQSTDDKWGWYNVDRAYIRDGRTEYLLILPEPRAIHRR